MHGGAGGLGLRQRGCQTGMVPLADDAGVVGIRGRFRIGGSRLRQRCGNEGVEGCGGHQHVVRRDAGLAGIQPFAEGDRPRRRVDGIVRADDRRRLAAEFQRHRRQVLGRRAHHLAADMGRAGEQQMVEGQRRERLGDRHVADDDRHLVGGEMLGDQALQQLGEARRQFRRLQHGAVAGRQRVGQRRQRQDQRIVPGRHDADDAERLVAHPGPARLEGDVDAAALRLHPSGERFGGVADGVEGRADLQELGLGLRALAEIGGDRRGEGIDIADDQPAQTRERVAACNGIRCRLAARGRMLAVEPRLQSVVVHGAIRSCCRVMVTGAVAGVRRRGACRHPVARRRRPRAAAAARRPGAPRRPTGSGASAARRACR